MGVVIDKDEGYNFVTAKIPAREISIQVSELERRRCKRALNRSGKRTAGMDTPSLESESFDFIKWIPPKGQGVA